MRQNGATKISSKAPKFCPEIVKFCQYGAINRDVCFFYESPLITLDSMEITFLVTLYSKKFSNLYADFFEIMI